MKRSLLVLIPVIMILTSCTPSDEELIQEYEEKTERMNQASDSIEFYKSELKDLFSKLPDYYKDTLRIRELNSEIDELELKLNYARETGNNVEDTIAYHKQIEPLMKELMNLMFLRGIDDMKKRN